MSSKTQEAGREELGPQDVGDLESLRQKLAAAIDNLDLIVERATLLQSKIYGTCNEEPAEVERSRPLFSAKAAKAEHDDDRPTIEAVDLPLIVIGKEIVNLQYDTLALDSCLAALEQLP